MELIEGETLSSLLRKGPLGFDRTLRYGQQVAAALAAAHASGIVHRDLKPGNIMVTKNGVKVLDFGLAKRASPEAAEQVVETLTASHIIVGTPAYMAPEQLEGKDCDARTDIFALGIVLHEMASGQRPFTGESHAALIAGIMCGVAAPIDNAPPQFAHVVERCLAKDPDARWQSAHDVKHELEWAATGAALPAPVAHRRWRWWLGLAALAAIVLGAGGAALWFRRAGPEERVYRFSLAPPSDTEFLSAPNRSGLALSPDGRSLVFLGVRGGQPRLWLQRLDSNTAHEIPGTDNASEPFWSPDGRSLGFYAGPSLKRIDVDGANLQVLAKARAPRGGSWGPDGAILFSPSIAAAIYRISATGGETVRITSADLHGGGKHSAATVLPVVVKLVAVAAAAERNDSIGSSNGPEHARALESGTHHGFASGFHNTGAYKQILPAEVGIAHAFGIPLEVVRLGPNCPVGGESGHRVN